VGPVVDVLARLVRDHEDHRLLLFAGAGLSMNLGLPSWSQLINHLASELNFDPLVFNGLGSFPMLAEFYKQEIGSIDSLVDWMRINWTGAHIPIGSSAIHRMVAQARFPVIYTTNYDPWIERAHEHQGSEFTKIVSGSDLVATKGTQIVKFHGDLDEPHTMVLTESDYFERLTFEHPLDIKLRADIQQYSVLFVGYSLNDPNIRLILHRLSRFRATLRAPSTPLCSYIFLTSNNNVQTSLLRRWNVEPIVSKELDHTLALQEFIAELRSGLITSAECP
jgi:hypothetical protein